MKTGKNLKIILKEELEKITPSKEEFKEIEEKTKKFAELLKKSGLKVEIGGSLAKGTLLKKSPQDIDLFVVFKEEREVQILENKLEKLKISFKKIHGSRDYFQINKNIGEREIIFELIPVLDFNLKNKFEKRNVTDFSLLHVKYIAGKIKKKKSLAQEVMLAKSFCHAQGIYGAESYIKGFSGYSLEVLVCYYGSFLKFLKEFGKKKIINPEKMWKNEKEIFREMNSNKTSGPIILIDPTNKYRNVLSCLSQESFEKFLNLSKKFLKNPSQDFFQEKNIEEKELKKQAEKSKLKLVKLSFSTEKQEGDIAGTKMKKYLSFIVDELKRKGQKIKREEFDYKFGKKAIGYLIVKENKEREIKGPPIQNRKACEEFKKVRKKVLNKKGFLYAKEEISIEKVLNFCKKFEKEMGVVFSYYL
jgi:tRNA nucleotidyltransferase (CCA-adding enzyme)